MWIPSQDLVRNSVGGVLMGQADDGSTLLGHCSRASHESQMSRLLQQTCEEEVRR